MSRIFVLLLVIGALCIGCNKNKNEAANPASAGIGDEGSGSQGGRGTVVKRELATGPLRELLLTLQRVHFGLDSSTLEKDAQDALSDAAEKLVQHPEVSLLVEGHTDERGTTEHNMALGERRAKTVVSYLTDHGVPETQLSLISHGEENPRAEGSSQSALAKNRRVDFQLMRGEIELVLEEGTLFDDQGNPIAEKAAEKPADEPEEEEAPQEGE
jgi:peptidoglycan-associated lipoprotein